MSDPLLGELLKMAKFETHLIVLSQWSARVTIIIGGNHEQHLEAFKRRSVSKAESVEYADYMRDEMRHNAAVVLQPKSRPSAQFVYFPQPPNLTKADVIGVVAHELLHVTIGILRRADVRMTDASEETYTYLHGHLMQEFWKKLTPKGKR